MSAFIAPILAVVALSMLTACGTGITSYQVATHKGCSVASGAGLTCTND
jgi:hypothetical protein